MPRRARSRRAPQLREIAHTHIGAERATALFDIVVVCTGNRNRSPLAEAALRRATKDLPVRVRSAGLIDLGPAPVFPETLGVAAEFGLDVSAHLARCIAGMDLSEADLVLGMELEHAAAAVVEHGARPERTFMLLELVELLDAVPLPPHGARPDPSALLAAVRGARAARRGSPRGVVDPFGGTQNAFTKMGHTIVAACDEIAGRLFGSSPRPDEADS